MNQNSGQWAQIEVYSASMTVSGVGFALTSWRNRVGTVHREAWMYAAVTLQIIDLGFPPFLRWPVLFTILAPIIWLSAGQ